MKKKISIALIIIFICCIPLLCIRMFFQNQIKELIKRNIFSEVIAKEDELSEVILALDSEALPEFIYYKYTEDIDELNWVAYKELDNPKISEAFKDFHLIFMRNEIEEKGFACFTIYPYADLLLGGNHEVYTYGFYYSKDDKPLNSSGESCDNQQYEEDLYIATSYKTEKITDNWWFYEEVIMVNAKK